MHYKMQILFQAKFFVIELLKLLEEFFQPYLVYFQNKTLVHQ